MSTRPTAADDATGALVVDVEPGSGAADAGLRAGDLIVALGDEPVGSPADLIAAIARRQPGDHATVTIVRDRDEQRVDVVLGAHDEVSS